ncbi:MAG: nucleotidyltransferase, partial [Algoriphagus sp.]|nr:nucleotidyltransferase [Algoriphagus sp.]
LPGGKTWFGVTYTEDRPVVIEALQQLHLQGEYPTTLW